MRVLYDADALAPTALADKMGMTKGAISKLAERLLDKSLVARSDHPHDKRAHTLSLTASGREKTPVLAAIADSNHANFFDVRKDDEGARLPVLLRILMDRSKQNIMPTACMPPPQPKPKKQPK